MKFSEFVSFLSENKEPVVIFGTGSLGAALSVYLRKGNGRPLKETLLEIFYGAVGTYIFTPFICGVFSINGEGSVSAVGFTIGTVFVIFSKIILLLLVWFSDNHKLLGENIIKKFFPPK